MYYPGYNYFLMLTSLADCWCVVILAKDLKLLGPCELFQGLEKADVPMQLIWRAVLKIVILLLVLFPHSTYILVMFILVKEVIFGRNTRISCLQTVTGSKIPLSPQGQEGLSAWRQPPCKTLTLRERRKSAESSRFLVTCELSGSYMRLNHMNDQCTAIAGL